MENTSLYRQVEMDMYAAMKNKDVKKRDLLRVVRGECDRIKNSDNHISDEDTLKIIRKMHNNAIDLKNDTEIKILEVYLPRMLEPKDIRVIVKNIIENNGYKKNDMGLIMGALNRTKEAALIDMETASTIVKEMLS